jgi:hypothetical protein
MAVLQAALAVQCSFNGLVRIGVFHPYNGFRPLAFIMAILLILIRLFAIIAVLVY